MVEVIRSWQLDGAPPEVSTFLYVNDRPLYTIRMFASRDSELICQPNLECSCRFAPHQSTARWTQRVCFESFCRAPDGASAALRRRA
jgi:hypothetical protein